MYLRAIASMIRNRQFWVWKVVNSFVYFWIRGSLKVKLVFFHVIFCSFRISLSWVYMVGIWFATKLAIDEGISSAEVVFY